MNTCEQDRAERISAASEAYYKDRIAQLEKAMHRITQECTARKAVQIARNALCTHADYSFAKHGRVCPCGKTMVGFGD